jgi:preprotein translocase subunit SecF
VSLVVFLRIGECALAPVLLLRLARGLIARKVDRACNTTTAMTMMTTVKTMLMFFFFFFFAQKHYM